jgi:hypothetical protein
MKKAQLHAERPDRRQAASQRSSLANADAALPRQHAQSQQIAQLRANASAAAFSKAGVVQLTKGKHARNKKKEAAKKVSDDKQIDPANKDLSHGLDTAFTGAKLDTSEVQGGHARDRHAAKDTNYLDGRNRKIASTFASETDQNAALEQLVAANDRKIKAWIAEQYGEPRLVISGEIEAVQVAARRKQKQVGVTSSGYEYADPTVPRFVDMDSESLSHATAVLERYLIKSDKKGQTPKVSWRVITCYPHPADEDDS